MAIEVFNRYEHKYLIEPAVYMALLQELDKYMELDAYNKNHMPYPIANIYYDTRDDYLIRRSLQSPAYKEKLRVRAYGVPNAEDMVFTEIKKKCGGLVNKRRTKMRVFKAYDFLRTGHLPERKEYMNWQVMREIEYFRKRFLLVPKVYIAYDRVAYFEKDNSDLRISFDMNIRTRRDELRLEAGDWGDALMDDDSVLMEIKTSRAKPLWLSHLLCELGIRRCSFSKYGREFKNQFEIADDNAERKVI